MNITNHGVIVIKSGDPAVPGTGSGLLKTLQEPARKSEHSDKRHDIQ